MRKILMTIAVFSLIMIFNSYEEVKDDDYDHMMLLATQVGQAFDLISDEKDRLGIENTHYSGMIGPEYTGITTTLGAYESKTTATNPNFSSAIYKYLKKMGLKPGDTIALNLSSSFPSLNIQTIMTTEALALKPIIITSIGASTFGATDLEMTYLDMESLLYEKGLIHSKSVLVSCGGDKDLGTNMDQASLSYVTGRLKTLGYQIYKEEDYKKNIDYRLDLYGTAKALINVGGNYVSHTENDIGYEMDYGLIEPSKYNYNKDGLIGNFISKGKPILHLLNIKDIAFENNLPIDPSNIELGSDGQFMKKRYSVTWAVILLISLSLLIMELSYERYRTKEKIIEDHVKQELSH